MELLKDYFYKKAKKGEVAEVRELVRYSLSKNLGLSRSAISKWLRAQPVSVRFGLRNKKEKAHVGTKYPKLGVYQLDYGSFRKRDVVANGQKNEFILAVEQVTHKLIVLPTTSKSTRWWRAAVKLIRDTFSTGVTKLFTDRDAVVTSPAFQASLKKDFGVTVRYLKNRSKAFLAERYIRKVKRELNKSCFAASSRRWTDFVGRVVRRHNNQFIKGTRFKRTQVHEKNFLQFLAQYFNSDSVHNTLSTVPARPSFLNEKLNKQIFKFRPGDTVVLARSADWTEARSLFDKTSSTGSYGSKVYTVRKRELHPSKKSNKLVKGRKAARKTKKKYEH